MNKLFKIIKNIFYSQKIFSAEFSVNDVSQELLKQFHDVHWFCHKLLHNQTIAGIQDIYMSGANIKVVFYPEEIKLEDLMAKLSQLGLKVSVIKIKPLISFFARK